MITFRCPKCQTVQNVYALPGTAFVTCSTCAARLEMPEMPGDAVTLPPPPRSLPVPSSAPAPRENDWFCTIDDERRGPFTAADMQRLADRDDLRPADLVWRSGWPQWRPAREFFQFPPPRPRSRPRRREYDHDRYDDRSDDRYDRYDDRIDFYRPRPPDDTASVTCGILSIIGGVMACIPCVGLVFGVAGLVLSIVSLGSGRDKTLGAIGLGLSLTGMAMNIVFRLMLEANRF